MTNGQQVQYRRYRDRGYYFDKGVEIRTATFVGDWSIDEVLLKDGSAAIVVPVWDVIFPIEEEQEIQE